RLEVAVDDAANMGVVDGLGHIGEQRGDRWRGLWSASSPLGQAAAGNEFQGEERQAVLFAHLIDLHNVGVLETGHDFGFGTKAYQVVGLGVRRGPNHLEGYRAVQADLPGPVDDAHAAPAELTLNLVAGQDRPAAHRP